MTKHKKTAFGIFIESVGLYFSNFDKFLKYMTFPVLGQLAGLILIFFTTYLYSTNLPKLIEKYPTLNNLSTLIILSIVVTLPGLAIFCKAFWEYLVAYGAVNSMFDNMIRSGKVYDFDAHTELIKRRTFSFLGLWLLFSIFGILSLCPLFWIICAVFGIYFILAFQVFTFESNLSPVGCLKKSFMLVKGSFGTTFLILALVFALTYVLIPQLILIGLDSVGVNIALSKGILPFVNLFPEINSVLYGLGKINSQDIALFLTQITVAQILIQYTLPLRSIVWSMWYKELNNGLPKQENSSSKKNSKKRPSEKLMEESRKKFSKKKIDNNILRRAMEKDDEE